jgi:hypothetical protein
MKILFYQAGTGFRGTATLREVAKTRPADWDFPGYGFRLFPIKLLLDDIETFLEPIDMKPLVQDLGFVTNKRRWGHAVQMTPRLIPQFDLQIILRGAHAQ